MPAATRWWSWVLALAVLACAAACGGEPAPYVVELGEAHRFRVGDDPSFATAELDDTSWTTEGLPATWRHRTTRSEVIGWHRFHVTLEAVPPGRLALDLGAIAWADEVFVNGQRIGGTGRFEPLPRLGLWPRLYRLPDGVLRAGANVLAIRVRGVPHGINGLFASRIGIGDELALFRARAGAIAWTQFAEGWLLGVLVLSALVIAFLPRRGRAGRATLSLLAMIASALLQLWLLSVTCREAGLSPEVGANVFIAVIIATGILYWGFVASVTRGPLPLPLPLRLVIAVETVIAALLLVWPRGIAILLPASVLIGAVGLVFVYRLAIRAIRAREPGGIPLAVGCGLPGLSVLAMLHLPQPFLVGLPVVYWGTIGSLGMAVLALTRHVHELNRQMQRATTYALEAHTRERSRLARDLHDGLGQMLALLKLQLQRAGRKHDGELVQRTFDDGAEQVGTTLDELRRVARDLRPAPLEDRSFAEALREYAAAMTQRTDLEVRVTGTYATSPREAVGDELYRIAQECLTNCLKHSGARVVDVTLSETKDRYGLMVTDDGRGLSDEDTPGLGLSTIRERSELLGGTCAITPAPGGGTRVDVTVPR